MTPSNALRGTLFALACCVPLLSAGHGAAITSPPEPTSPLARALAQFPARFGLPDRRQRPLEQVINGSFALGLSNWESDSAVLVGSPLRRGGQAANLGGVATQHLAASALQAGTAYTLFVNARVDQRGAPAQVGVLFRMPAGAEIIRNYQTGVTSTELQLVRVDFTAPPYAEMAEVRLSAGAARLLVDSVSLVAREPIVQTEPVSTRSGSYAPAGYRLAFNDEFSGHTLNRSKWFTRYLPAGGTLDRLNDEQERYRDHDNHRVAGGALSLIARKVSTTDPWGVNYESGMVRSDWTARYGYFEARVKMPRGIGLWPAFWLVSDVSARGELSWPPEIDIFEFVNNGVEDRANMLHSGVVTPPGVTSALTYVDRDFNTDWNFYTAPFNFDEGWHTVGLEWTPTSVTQTVDGKKIYTRNYLWNFSDGSLAAPAHILLNLAVGGGWAGRHGIDDAVLPQSLQIDWVRAYTKLP